MVRMTTTRKNTFMAAALAVALTIGASACGDDDSATETGDADQTETTVADDSMEDDSMEDDSMEDEEHMEDDSMEDDSMEDDSMEDDSMEEDSDG